jgi:hypothetical protein
VIEYSANLLGGDPGKPIDELGDRRTVFKILEQGRYRYASASENPGAAHALRVPIDSKAR